jgi:hypothetical protein
MKHAILLVVIVILFMVPSMASAVPIGWETTQNSLGEWQVSYPAGFSAEVGDYVITLEQSRPGRYCGLLFSVWPMTGSAYYEPTLMDLLELVAQTDTGTSIDMTWGQWDRGVHGLYVDNTVMYRGSKQYHLHVLFTSVAGLVVSAGRVSNDPADEAELLLFGEIMATIEPVQ